ncbi:unnamed protein product [Parascedosporium putredinis]|uniref:Uncharacterized protein n=1 Tax=Parascedosporium putredinis TaxID=1442378 RepID=A0A9P1H7Z3_9PEZI|nr:unnamed protein product [Parascedosporium putredinis]CAI8000193.1 unnamed protein product [Parascedosporium putredinis]
MDSGVDLQVDGNRPDDPPTPPTRPPVYAELHQPDSHHELHLEAPPAYAYKDRGPLPPRPIILPPAAYRAFPAVVSLHRKPSINVADMGTLKLCEDESGDNVIYLVKIHDISVHASKLLSFNSNSCVFVPCLHPTTTPFAREVMRVVKGQKTATFQFSFEVGSDGLRRDTFEWRKSARDPEIPSNGFKLVRLAPSFSSTTTPPPTENVSAESDPSTSDSRERFSSASFASCRTLAPGEETVAVLTWGKVPVVGKHEFTLRFVGSGLTGEFGQRWSLAVVATALRVWILRSDGRTTKASLAIGTRMWGILADMLLYGDMSHGRFEQRWFEIFESKTLYK